MKKCSYLFYLFIFFTFVITNSAFSNKSFVILIPSYNNEKFCYWNIASALNQKYDNFRIIYINDRSSDNTIKVLKESLKKFNNSQKVTIIDNKERKLALQNIYETIHYHIQDDEIVIILDGDDALAHENVLSTLNQAYSNENVWLTYGQFKMIKAYREPDFSVQIPSNIVKENSFRTKVRNLSHLRTFYAWLFKLINKQDLLYEGDFFRMTYDLAIMFPMVEMAGFRFKYIPDILYIYNDTNPINDNKVNAALQRTIEKYIRNKTPYQPLESKPSR